MKRLPIPLLIAIGMLVLDGLATAATGREHTMLQVLLSFAAELVALSLLVTTMVELRHRVAAVGFAMIMAVRLVGLGASMHPAWWENEVFRDATTYSSTVAHLVVMIALARAVFASHRLLACCAVAAALVAAPLPFVYVAVARALVTSDRGFYIFMLLIRLPEYAVLCLIVRGLVRDEVVRPVLAASGLRHSARAMCMFAAVIAFVAIGTVRASLWLPVLETLALGWAGFGLLRSARLPLSRWQLTVAAVAVMLAAALALASVPSIYRGDPLPNLLVLTNILSLVASALVMAALGDVVDKVQLQGKGMGAMFMFITALAIQVMLTSPSHPHGARVALGVLTGFSMALGAWMLSILCRYGAQRLEATDGALPPARLV